MKSETNLQSKRQKLARNSIYGVISWLFPILPTFVVTPIVIRSLGNELYGVYALVLGFTAYFFTLNIGRAVTKYVAEYKATGQADRISISVSATLQLNCLVGLITTLVIVFFSGYFVKDILQITPDLQDTAAIALYLGCLNILVNMMGFTFQAFLQGLQRFDVFVLITNISSLLLAVGTLTTVLNGYGVIGLFSVSLAVSTISAVASAILAKRALPELKFHLLVSRETWAEVWKYGVSIMAYQLFGSILLIFERSWITRQFGTEALAFYVVPMTLALYLPAFVSSLVSAMFPVINEHLSQRAVLADLYRQSTRLIIIFLAFACISAAAAGRAFLELWLNRQFAEESYEFLLIHVLIFSIASLTITIWQIAESFRSAPVTAAANFAWMTISIPLMVLLSMKWQMLGVAYGRLGGLLIYIPLIIYVERRFLGGAFWWFWASVGFRVVVAALLAGSAEYVVLKQFSLSWSVFGLSVSIGGFVFLLLLYTFRLFGANEGSMLRLAFLGKR